MNICKTPNVQRNMQSLALNSMPGAWPLLAKGDSHPLKEALTPTSDAKSYVDPCKSSLRGSRNSFYF